MLVVAAYDIADDRRRHRVSLCLAGKGSRVQLSVFECDVDGSDGLRSLRNEVERLIDPHLDQVRFYALGAAGEPGADILGQHRLEEREDFYIV